MIEIEAPDGSIVEFPQGTDDETIMRVMRESYPVENYQQRIEQAHDEANLDPRRQGDTLTPRETTIGDKLYDVASAMGLPASRMRNKTNAAGAFIDATAQSATFNTSDELEAGIKSLAGRKYEEELKGIRGRQAYNREQYPKASLMGDVVGTVGTGAAFTKSGILASGRLGQGASLGQKTKAAALDSAGLGYMYGFGAGEDLEDRITGGITNAAISAPLGASIPVVGAGLRAGSRMLKDRLAPHWNAALNPQKEASRRVAGAFDIDDAPIIDDATAAINNQQILNVDRGGETTRALARSVANQNPEARSIIEKTASDRFASQGERARGLIDRLLGGSVDDVAYQQSVLDAAKKTNRPAYRKAYEYNYGDKLPVEFDDIMQRIPANAATNAKKIAKAEGRPFGEQLFANIDEAADTVTFSRLPSIREWDSIQRGLRSATNKAYKSGAGDVGNAYKKLHRELLNTMDDVNPLFKEARRGAASFFGADDSIEAGRKFVSMTPGNDRQLRSAMSKMSKAEREGFSIGFAAELRGQISKAGDRTNVINKIWGSKAARDKVRFALGDKGYREFESFVRIENTMDMLRSAMGNSTTARQLVELGIGAGVGGASTGDWQGALTGAVLARAVRAGGAKANQNTMKFVADILLSKDPAKLKRGAELLAKSAEKRKSLDQIQQFIQSTIQAPIAATTGTLSGEL